MPDKIWFDNWQDSTVFVALISVMLYVLYQFYLIDKSRKKEKIKYENYINPTIIVLVSITVRACTKGGEVILKMPPVSPFSKVDTTYYNLIVR